MIGVILIGIAFILGFGLPLASLPSMAVTDSIGPPTDKEIIRYFLIFLVIPMTIFIIGCILEVCGI